MNLFDICKGGNPTNSPRRADLQTQYKYVQSHKQINMNQRRSVLKNENIKIVKTGPFIVECSTTTDSLTGEAIITIEDSNQIIFVGSLLNGLREGYGKEFDQDGNVDYEGQYLQNMRSGWGKTPEYSGEFKDSKYSGYGRFITNKQFYEGTFMEGKYSGIGVLIRSDDGIANKRVLWEQPRVDEYIQQKIEKEPQKLFENNEGDFNIQQIYIGQFSNGYKNGTGKIWRNNGEYWYFGQFSHDFYHGNGTLHLTNNDISKGMFLKGKFMG